MKTKCTDVHMVVLVTNLVDLVTNPDGTAWHRDMNEASWLRKGSSALALGQYIEARYCALETHLKCSIESQQPRSTATTPSLQ